jgi:hypothetical protein
MIVSVKSRKSKINGIKKSFAHLKSAHPESFTFASKFHIKVICTSAHFKCAHHNLKSYLDLI